MMTENLVKAVYASLLLHSMEEEAKKARKKHPEGSLSASKDEGSAEQDRIEKNSAEWNRIAQNGNENE